MIKFPSEAKKPQLQEHLACEGKGTIKQNVTLIAEHNTPLRRHCDHITHIQNSDQNSSTKIQTKAKTAFP